ncbi:hypothetical protein Syun_010168 [Stephania yunnanensis]|uniref:Uncharacterized protein n=1 Tax=Stephania yunnanensis TaxID=152371 RepID=A0AAP0KI55_9MAGN
MRGGAAATPAGQRLQRWQRSEAPASSGEPAAASASGGVASSAVNSDAMTR